MRENLVISQKCHTFVMLLEKKKEDSFGWIFSSNSLKPLASKEGI